ncbi:hypothetical protein J7K24_00020 [bacterium]|nr:hypothetical protein [bacterium]
MDEEIEERIDSYLEMYGRILYKVSGKWPEHGIDIAGRVFEEISKDLRSEMIVEMRRRDYQVNRDERNCKIDGVLATRKQRETLHRFGVKNIPDDLSLEEASDILEELIDLSRHGNKDLLLREIEVLNEKWQRR